MPTLKITNDKSEYQIEKGTSLLEFCQDNNTVVPFGCCAGACGTCRVTVIENPENLSTIDEDEKSFLEDFVVGSGPNDRLACQCEILGDVTIEVVDSGNHNHPTSSS